LHGASRSLVVAPRREPRTDDSDGAPPVLLDGQASVAVADGAS